MNINTKLKLAQITSYLMMATTFGILIWFVGFIFSVAFDLNVFSGKTTEILFAALGGAFVLVTCSAILNVSLNISIIAEKNIVIDENEKTKVNYKNITAFSGTIFLLIIIFLFGGDYLTRLRFKNNLISEGNDIVNRYSETIEQIKISLNDKNKISNIPDDVKFLSNIKSDFPSVIVISSDIYNSEIVFLMITERTKSINLFKPYFDNAFYKCTNNDCDYLYDVFENEVNEPYFWNDKDDYLYYYPVENGDNDFVLLFSERDRYGYIGER